MMTVFTNSKETLATIALGLVIPSAVIAFGVGAFSVNFRSAKYIRTTRLPLSIVSASDVFSNEELSALKSTWAEDAPEGEFIKDRHGFTHFVLNSPNLLPSERGLVVLAHGLGVSLKMYQDLAMSLVDEGFSVLRYDYYGHGYSKHGSDTWVEYSPNMFIDQLEDLLEHVCKRTKENVIGIVGHSTGGIVAIACNDRWRSNKESKRKAVKKIVLASPALYAKKPLMARVADKFPRALSKLMKTIPSLRFIIGDAYLEAGSTAFAHEPDDLKVAIYGKEEVKKEAENCRLFGRVKGVEEHPFLAGGILGINCNTLRGDLLPDYRTMLLDNLKNSPECSVHWLWGDLDMTVPFNENFAQVNGWTKENKNMNLMVLKRMGHELFYEDSKVMADEIVPFFKS
mmetsp:Transcript_23091/g.34214  ORF Transcript_23091/g.34214 Transcript_23091/m.34214 type:complete len:398 (+) Transcript_23091:229-1422(+)